MKFLSSLALFSIASISTYAHPLESSVNAPADSLNVRSHLVARKDDYPYPDECGGVDPWGFYKCQCTSFVAFRINKKLDIKFTNWYKGEHFGNANIWDTAAKNAKVTMNKTPKVQSVAQRDKNDGHVAWVLAVDGDTITVEEYNWKHHVYTQREVDKSTFDNFIHFK